MKEAANYLFKYCFIFTFSSLVLVLEAHEISIINFLYPLIVVVGLEGVKAIFKRVKKSKAF